MKRRRRRRRPIAWYFWAAAVTSPTLWAAEWSVQPSADVQVEYNDNVRLLPGHAADAAGGVLNAGLRMKRADERGYLSLTPTLRATRYDSRESLDGDDQMLKAEWSRRGEYSTWRVDAAWTRDTTLTSELEVSGLVQARKRRLLRYLAPSFSYAPSPRVTLGVNTAYTAVEYQDARFTGLVDYTYASADVSGRYQWSERTAVTGVVYATRLDAELIANRTDTTGMQLQLHSALSERWNVEASAGVRHSDGKGIVGQDADGWLAKLGLSRQDESGQWRLMISRSVDPSGTGVLVQRDQWLVTREQALTERWRLTASGQWSVNQDLPPLAASSDRDYRSAYLRLSRVLTPAWSVYAAYSYAWQEYTGALDQAERNAVMLGVHYSGTPVTE